MVEPQQEYLRRLADIDAAVDRARPHPDLLLERAAGLLAGQVGWRVGEAHAHLLRLAESQGRPVHQVAEDTLAVLEGQPSLGSRRRRTAVTRALRARHAALRERRLARAGSPTGDWVAVGQQLLDVLDGDHALLQPVYDEGAITDFVIVAASPSATDTVGHRGPELLGLRVRAGYPLLVDGPLWKAWVEVATGGGAAREVGPFPYLTGAAGELIYTVRVSRVGGGLLSTWRRRDDGVRLSERIEQTERLGALGWGEWDLVTGVVVWSEGLYRVYDRDPADGPLSSEESSALTVPEDRALDRIAAEAFGRGETVDLRYRIRLGDRIKHLRSVIDAERDVHGRPLKVYGIIQDVTGEETSRERLTQVEAQLREHRGRLAAEHRLAARLQEIILPIPDAPIDLPGLRVAIRYLPAEQADRVGGDWYHAAAAADGSVVLAVGDVAGHGIPAAATMARLRHALAALVVTTDTDPAALLGSLNRLLRSGSALTETATAVVARFDPASRTVAWAQAGHPAPLLARAGVTTELPRPAGPLLGALNRPAYETASLSLQPDDLLMFYTDGLVERRGRSVAEGLAPVVAVLNRVSAEGSGQPLADLVARMRRANPDDDTCILTARLHG